MKRGKKKNSVKNLKNKNEMMASFLEKLESIDYEIKNDVTPAVVASFGFIIALVWRDAIKETLDYFLRNAGIVEQAYIYNFISAIIVTLIVIVIMIIVTKYGRKKERKIKKEFKEKLKDLKE